MRATENQPTDNLEKSLVTTMSQDTKGLSMVLPHSIISYVFILSFGTEVQ